MSVLPALSAVLFPQPVQAFGLDAAGRRRSNTD